MSSVHYTLNHEYNRIRKTVRQTIELENPMTIMHADLKELIDYYLQMNYLTPLIIDTKRTELADFKLGTKYQPEKFKKEGFNNLSKISYEYEELFIAIPIQPHHHAETLKQFGPNVNKNAVVRWKEDKIVFKIEVKGLNFHKSEDELANETAATKQEIYDWIQNLNTQIANHNDSLRNDISNWIRLRREKLLATKERHDSLLRRINIPLHKKHDETLQRIQLDPKPLIRRVKPSPQMEDYVIDRPKVLDIIELMDNYGRQLERTPKTFLDSGEEDLRNIFLVGLNGVFEGKATGETFLNKGKTDIYLNIEKGKILVGECKLWGGKQLYNNTIDQLLSYLTWRNNYGILINFVRAKSLIKAVGEAKNAIPNHPSYKKGLDKISDAHMVSQHRLPTDGLKNVELHHLFYHLYVHDGNKLR